MNWQRLLLEICVVVVSVSSLMTIFRSSLHDRLKMWGSFVSIAGMILVGLFSQQFDHPGSTFRAYLRSEYSLALWCLGFGIVHLLFKVRTAQQSHE